MVLYTKNVDSIIRVIPLFVTMFTCKFIILFYDYGAQKKFITHLQ